MHASFNLMAKGYEGHMLQLCQLALYAMGSEARGYLVAGGNYRVMLVAAGRRSGSARRVRKHGGPMTFAAPTMLRPRSSLTALLSPARALPISLSLVLHLPRHGSRATVCIAFIAPEAAEEVGMDGGGAGKGNRRGEGSGRRWGKSKEAASTLARGVGAAAEEMARLVPSD